MAKNIQAVRGMNDLLPPVSYYWSHLERLLLALAGQYGYQEVRFPIVEATELFTKSIGDGTDIVEKEMYSFVDQGGEHLTLRPEGTASCVRVGLEHGLFYNQIQRLCYCGPMFRHERPQKGRYRQFHQFGVEAYGLAGPEIDLELMLLARHIWQRLGLADEVTLSLNTLGSAVTRQKYRQCLVEFFQQHFDLLDEDSRRRLTLNPLRILDSKNPQIQTLVAEAPKITDYLDYDAGVHFERLCALLDQLKISYTLTPTLVRGLDYYNLTVFEWVIKSRGHLAQSTVCGGGHYDTLVESMGGKATPAIGFAIGIERLFELITDRWQNALPPKVVILPLGSIALVAGMQLAEDLRRLVDYTVVVEVRPGNLAAQLKRADKAGADFAVILGEDELASQQATVKYLRREQPQVTVPMVATVLSEILR